MTFYTSALSPYQICSVSDEILIKRFNKLLETLFATWWIRTSSVDHAQSDFSSSLKMIKCIHPWKA